MTPAVVMPEVQAASDGVAPAVNVAPTTGQSGSKSPDHVVGHRDCKSTDCPGRYVSVTRIRQQSIQILAAAGDPIPVDRHPTAFARGEMLHDN